jgi:hypothetical protein
MDPKNEEAYRQRIVQLEAENARLRQRLDIITADRRELYQRVYGPTEAEHMATEEECLVAMKTHVPGSGMKWLAEMGLYPRKPA